MILIKTCCASVIQLLDNLYNNKFLILNSSKLLKIVLMLKNCKDVENMNNINIKDLLANYDKKDLTIATVCSHSSLQIFNGAKKEGFKTLGIVIGEKRKFYDAFPMGKPDEFLIVENYKEILNLTDDLRNRNSIIIPHGSFVEYLGPENFIKLNIPTFGNRNVLLWESDRNKERHWLEGAGLTMPQEIKNPKSVFKVGMDSCLVNKVMKYRKLKIQKILINPLL